MKHDSQLEPALHSNDEKVLSDASFALWHLSYGSENGIQSVIEAGVVPRVVQFLMLVLPLKLITLLYVLIMKAELFFSFADTLLQLSLFINFVHLGMYVLDIIGQLRYMIRIPFVEPFRTLILSNLRIYLLEYYYALVICCLCTMFQIDFVTR